jgi:hypothetical protein
MEDLKNTDSGYRIGFIEPHGFAMAQLVRLRHKPNGNPAHAVISGKNSQPFNPLNAASLLGFCNL